MDYTTETENRFSSLICICGILSIMSVFTGIFPLILGAIGVLLSCIGHRKGATRTPSETLGLATSIIGLGIGCFLFYFAFATVLIPYYTDPEAFAKIQEIYQAYGFDLKSLLDGAMPR